MMLHGMMLRLAMMLLTSLLNTSQEVCVTIVRVSANVRQALKGELVRDSLVQMAALAMAHAYL